MQTANKFLMGEERKVEFSMYQNKGKKKKKKSSTRTMFLAGELNLLLY